MAFDSRSSDVVDVRRERMGEQVEREEARSGGYLNKSEGAKKEAGVN
jgi:hypothetical protein